jgi:peroxiredoxin
MKEQSQDKRSLKHDVSSLLAYSRPTGRRLADTKPEGARLHATRNFGVDDALRVAGAKQSARRSYVQAWRHRLKAIFITVYPFLALTIVARAVWSLANVPDKLAWYGTLLASAPLLLFMSVLLRRRRARTSVYPKWITVGTLAGVALALSRVDDAESREAVLLALVSAATVASYLGWYSRFGRAPSASLQEGKPLPAFELRALDGSSVRSTQFLGRPALLLFYRGNWCPLCSAQIRELSAQYRELDALGVQVVLISPQPEESSRALARRMNVPFQFLADPENRAAIVLGILDPGGVPVGMGAFGYGRDTVLPTVIVVDAKGRVRWRHETDNYRLRPEPETFLPILRELVARPG